MFHLGENLWNLQKAFWWFATEMDLSQARLQGLLATKSWEAALGSPSSVLMLCDIWAVQPFSSASVPLCFCRIKQAVGSSWLRQCTLERVLRGPGSQLALQGEREKVEKHSPFFGSPFTTLLSAVRSIVSFLPQKTVTVNNVLFGNRST